MMGIIAMQILFIWFWLHTYGRALSSLRVLHVRTAGVFGWGWFSQSLPTTGLTLVCDLLVAAHILGLLLSLAARDQRFFSPTKAQ
jgi:hypothetical protein